MFLFKVEQYTTSNKKRVLKFSKFFIFLSFFINFYSYMIFDSHTSTIRLFIIFYHSHVIILHKYNIYYFFIFIHIFIYQNFYYQKTGESRKTKKTPLILPPFFESEDSPSILLLKNKMNLTTILVK